MTLVTYQLIRKHSNFLVSHNILEGNPVFINLFKFSGSQENTTLSVVRVNDTAGDSSTDVNITLLLMKISTCRRRHDKLLSS